MISARIARRYANALLSIGREDGESDTYKKELASFANLMAENKEIEQFLVCPLYDAEGRKRVLEALVKRMGPSKIMASFLILLFDKGRIKYVKDIYLFYEKLTDQLANIVRAEVLSAVHLAGESMEKIKNALSKQTGKNIILEAKVDPSLIGGVVTKIGDLILDGSVKTQLIGLKESLQRGEGI